jgi:hypothetical protein
MSSRTSNPTPAEGLFYFEVISHKTGLSKHHFPKAFLISKQFLCYSKHFPALCGLVVRVPCYRSRGPGFDSRGYRK